MKVFQKICISLLILLSISSGVISQTNNNKATALVIIDIQEFYFPDGSLPLFEPEKAAEKAKILLSHFREHEMTVIHVRHNARSGAEIHKLVSPIEDEKIISKNKANAA